MKYYKSPAGKLYIESNGNWHVWEQWEGFDGCFVTFFTDVDPSLLEEISREELDEEMFLLNL